jgi:hypothetical protein
MAAATVASPKASPPATEGFVGGDDDRGPFVAGRDELEEQVGGFAVEGDVADLVADEERDPTEASELCLEAALVVGVAEAGNPFGGGGESDAVAGLADPDAEAGGEVRLAGARWAEEHDVVFGVDGVEGAVGDHLAFQAALMVEVEVLQALWGEAGGSDPVSLRRGSGGTPLRAAGRRRGTLPGRI